MQHASLLSGTFTYIQNFNRLYAQSELNEENTISSYTRPLSARSSVNCWTTWSHIDHCRFRNPFLFLIDQAFCFLGCFLGCFNISALKVLQRVSVWLRNSCSEINGFLKRNYKLCAVIQMLLTKPPRLWVSSLRVPRRSNRRFNLYATSVSLSRLSFVESFGDWRG